MFIQVHDLPTQWTSPESKYSTLASKACKFPLPPNPYYAEGAQQQRLQIEVKSKIDYRWNPLM